MKAALIDTQKGITLVDVKDDYRDFNRLIKAETGTVVDFTCGGKFFVAWADDEALLRGVTPVMTMLNMWHQVFGNVLIFPGETDDDGDFLSLTEDDYKILEEHMHNGVLQMDN